jgi:hypothetical protein
MSAGYPLGAEQGISEPEGLTTEPEQPEETEERQPVASFGGEPAGHAQATGQATQPLAGYLQPAQFAGNHSGGGSFGGSAPQHQPAVAPGDSARAAEINQHARDANAQLRGRYASQNGRSQGDVNRQWGSG